MFDGVPADQFHRFLAASSRASLPIPLSFSPLHHQQHHHHGVSIPVPIPISIPSSVSASPAPVPVPPVIAPAPTAGQTPGFLGCFDLYPSHQILEVVQQPQPHLHNHHSGIHPGQLQHQQSTSPPADFSKNGNCEERSTEPIKEEDDRRRKSIPPPIPPPPAAAANAYDDIPWSNDEVLTLLRIRSGMENWFPEFTWEHVSRKLEKRGYRRSAHKCKEKFEEESRQFNSLSYNKNYRFFSDLDELYNDDHDQSNHQKPKVSNEKGQDLEREKDLHHHEEPEAAAEDEDKMDLSHQQEVEETENAVNPYNPSHEEGKNAVSLVEEANKSISNKKRKRKHKLQMFKGFCETVVKRIVAQQEDLHKKLIEDMLKRDEECIAREEARKCQEMERFNKEFEMRAQEQVIVGDRQAKIIDLLKKFTTTSGNANLEQDQNLMRKIEDFFKVKNNISGSSTPVATSSSEIFSHLHPNRTSNLLPTPTSSSEKTPSPKNHYSTTTQQQLLATSSSVLAITSKSPNENSLALVQLHNKNFSSTRKSSRKMTGEGEKDAGKRWPKDEVQALINLKCSQTNNSSTTDHDKEPKGPLWERISQGMLELGYKRSAKRCKEKWENINKYFRKTKDSNKKRSVESRTCPYFHQLTTLYSQQQQQGTTTHNNDDNNNNNVEAPNYVDDHRGVDQENCPNSPHKKLVN